MPRILDRVRARRDEISNNAVKAKETGDLAVAAIMGGVRSVAWRTYMAHFGGLDTDQLKRLNAEDDTEGDETQDQKRAYMLANAVCGMASPMTRNLDLQVNTIDEGLPGVECDPEPNPGRLAG